MVHALAMIGIDEIEKKSHASNAQTLKETIGKTKESSVKIE
jgi:hypothetical protein